MIVVWTRTPCVGCDATKRWLTEHEVPFEARDLMEHPDDLQRLISAGFGSAPIVEADGHEAFAGFQPDRLRKLKEGA
ncbi:glutaredoxin domain-containing protein [Paenirhodobacter populi]|uniref:glutaredoxin domain-containing protein n=1 Tax=Paenirhodobacter populi TaxID=2306993 RepID=UPI000FE3CD19|nr:glutaredoxin domain-containing protein [Sinirhodobacter populi]RWR09795.1 NrdH-redoxin [Sinirhodobacter populi]